MAEQIYFEDIEEGSEIPILRKDPTTQQLVKYAVLQEITTKFIMTKDLHLITISPMSFCMAHSRMLSLVN